jgi:hypothetical protein
VHRGSMDEQWRFIQKQASEYADWNAAGSWKV